MCKPNVLQILCRKTKADVQKKRYDRYLTRQRSRAKGACAVGGSPLWRSFRTYHAVDPSGAFAFPFHMRKAQSAHRPIVMFLHGGGCIGLNTVKPLAEFLMHHLGVLLHKDCTVLLPQMPMNGFIDDDAYVHSLRRLCEWAAEQTRADTDRIYVFGISRGGWMTWRSVFAYPGFYACAMPIEGAFRSPELEGFLKKAYEPGALVPFLSESEIREQYAWREDDVLALRDTPIWVAHASDDRTVSILFDDLLVDALRAIGAPVRYSRWDRLGRKMSGPFLKTEPWLDWMFAQNLRNR